MLTTGQAGKRLGVHAATVRRWARAGRITFTWVGRVRGFDPREIERLRRCRQQRRAPASENDKWTARRSARACQSVAGQNGASAGSLFRARTAVESSGNAAGGAVDRGWHL